MYLHPLEAFEIFGRSSASNTSVQFNKISCCELKIYYTRKLIEAALAHKLPDKVERAYVRTDYFDKRRELMRDWADFVGSAANG